MKKDFLKDKRFKYGSYAFGITVIVIAVIVFVNVILSVTDASKVLRIDVTKDKLFSLSQQSLDILAKLDKDVEIYVLSPENQFENMVYSINVTEAFSQYNMKSGGKIRNPQYIDLDKDPTFVTKNLDPEQIKGIARGDIVVKCGKRIKVLTYSDFFDISYDYYGNSSLSGIKVEDALTGAIVNVTSDFTSKVAFVTDYSQIPNNQISQLRSMISLNNYEMQDLSLANPVPEDISVLFFAAPGKDLIRSEMDNLLSFLEKGGDAIFLFDVQETDQDMTNFNEVFNRYYLHLNNDYVMEFDQQHYLNNPQIIYPVIYVNDVTRNMKAHQKFIYLMSCRSITDTAPAKDHLKNFKLFSTTGYSARKDLKTGEEQEGMFTLGALGQMEVGLSDYSRIALIGDSTFITDAAIYELGDSAGRYILSMLNWMQDEVQKSVYIPTKSLAKPPLNLTEQSKLFIFILLIALLPLLIMGSGVFVWIRRRNL